MLDKLHAIPDDIKRLFKNSFSLFVLQAANYLLPLITIPYLLRVLGPEKYGLIAFAAAVMQYLAIVTDYGFNFTATQSIALHRNDSDKISEIVASVMFIKTVLLAIGFIFIVILVAAIPKFYAEWQVYAGSFLIVIGSVIFPLWFFQGMEQMKYITVLAVSSKAITTIAIFIFVQARTDYIMAVFIQSSSTVIAGVISIFVVKKKFSLKLKLPKNIASVLHELREGWKIFSATLAGNVYGQGAVVITGLIAGSASAGYYAIGQKISAATVGLIQPIATALYPYLCTNARDRVKIRLFRSRILIATFIVGIIAATALWLNVDRITVMINGKYDRDLAIVITIFAAILIFDQLNVMINSFIMALKQFDAIQRMYIVVSAIFLVVSIPATYTFGVAGMAFTMLLVVELFVLLGSLYILNRGISRI
jgi:polysaccharide transporter, PST family